MMLIDPYFNDIEKELYVDIFQKNYRITIPYKSFEENKGNILDIAKKACAVYLVKEGIGLLVDSHFRRKGLSPHLISCKELDYHVKHINSRD